MGLPPQDEGIRPMSIARVSRLSMISILRNNNSNRRRTARGQVDRAQRRQQQSQHRPATRNRLNEIFRNAESNLEQLSNNSIDNLSFAACLGLQATRQITPSNANVPSVNAAALNANAAVLNENAAVSNEIAILPRLAAFVPDLSGLMPNQNPAKPRRPRVPNTLSSHVCKYCGKSYRWKSTMRRHESLECGNKPPSFQCSKCAYRARQRGNLTVHFKRHHADKNIH